MVLGDKVDSGRLYPRGIVGDSILLCDPAYHRVSKDVKREVLELVEIAVIKRSALFKNNRTWD